MRAALSALFLLAACATGAPPASLSGTDWTLQSMPGVNASASMHRPSVGFESGRAHGNAGCNAWSADYTQDGSKLHFGQALHTMMACVGGMDVEHAFTDALQHTSRAEVSNNQLILRDDSGRELARFDRSEAQGS
jgi:heat shock protein HslJ